ncbi:hypothetical protein SAZ11_08145 [Streptomyces sp. FXJ1.4098]|nr:hypothetical protein [Streptomyces sp. FXJ1.4098]
MSQTALPVRTDDPVTSYEVTLEAVVGASRVQNQHRVVEFVKVAGPESGPTTARGS